MSANLAKIVDDLSALSVMEAADLSKMLEEKWGVSAAAPVAMAAAAAPGAAAVRADLAKAPAVEAAVQQHVASAGPGGPGRHPERGCVQRHAERRAQPGVAGLFRPAAAAVRGARGRAGRGPAAVPRHAGAALVPRAAGRAERGRARVRGCELGGAGGVGTNPEQLFAAGYSACFLGAMKFVAARDKLPLPPKPFPQPDPAPWKPLGLQRFPQPQE